MVVFSAGTAAPEERPLGRLQRSPFWLLGVLPLLSHVASIASWYHHVYCLEVAYWLQPFPCVWFECAMSGCSAWLPGSLWPFCNFTRASFSHFNSFLHLYIGNCGVLALTIVVVARIVNLVMFRPLPPLKRSYFSDIFDLSLPSSTASGLSCLILYLKLQKNYTFLRFMLLKLCFTRLRVESSTCIVVKSNRMTVLL